MWKKVLLFFVIFLIFLFSHTPSLEVLDYTTWFHIAEYKSNINSSVFIDIHSQFFRTYKFSDLESTEFIVRKIAHITFYSLLSILLYINFKRYKFIISMFLTFVIASLDEIDQMFIVGRSGRFIDIALDFSSSFLVLLLYILIIKYFQNKKV